MAEGYLKGKPDVNWWLTQIRQGVEYRKKFAYQAEWNTWRAYYRGDWKPGILPVNLFFKMLRSTVPRVYFRNPRVSIIAKRPGADALARAKILERVDNKLLRRMKVKDQIKRIVQDTFLFGTGVGKLGYGAEFTPTPDDVDTSAPVSDRKYRIEYNSTVMANMPWFMRVDPGHFIVPKGLTSLSDARWVAHWLRRPLADVQDDPRMKNVAGLTPTSRSGASELAGFNRSDRATGVDMVDLIEVRDKKSSNVFVLAPFASDKILFSGDDDLQIAGGVPFYSTVFNLDDERFWGIPDSKILEPQQLEMNENRTQIMMHRRLSIIKVLVREGGMTTTEAEKFVSEDVNSVVWTQLDPDLAVKVMQASTIPPELFQMEDRIYNDVRENLGFSRNEAGEFQGGSRKPTATEVNVVRRASEIRVDERRDIVADLLVDMVSDMHQIIFSKWNEEQIIDVAGPDGAPVWVRFQGDMLKSGHYEVSIDPDTGVPETKDVRRERAAEEYSILKENPLIDPDKLTRYLLNEIGGVAHDDLMVSGAPGSQQNPMDVDQFAGLFGGQ